ncbi:hypothetical protein ACIBI3_02145 [Actinomadura luteofluorescens]|uniref:hypothetical protein n=1 Tax=Actinomadura luteofluorescens TaxID=46163 RepID=UPI00347B1148
MDAPTAKPPWGQLIDDGRDRLRPAVSQNSAAQRAGISGTRWRQIVDGRAGAMDSDRGVNTVARMAEVAGVTPQQLEEAGRPDVAAELRLLLGEETAAVSPRSTASAGTTRDGAVSLTVHVNPDDPEPEFPPGGLRSQAERIIWAMVDEPWQVRLAQILTGREVEASMSETRKAAGNGE